MRRGTPERASPAGPRALSGFAAVCRAGGSRGGGSDVAVGGIGAYLRALRLVGQVPLLQLAGAERMQHGAAVAEFRLDVERGARFGFLHGSTAGVKESAGAPQGHAPPQVQVDAPVHVAGGVVPVRPKVY